ncbi:hypothetical protein QCE62_22785 [Caballeronia sp. LZ033]|uniref:hypothetical protein n=1 Tax=Caballeronia sp. LZ033 TaxID=3038566 RepID=UPI00286159C2|nr:hypothetical protein [Caballeronia sp. LZ033]MDR5816421.1 hypothetical protein [Caballeronia sp. LZ033]
MACIDFLMSASPLLNRRRTGMQRRLVSSFESAPASVASAVEVKATFVLALTLAMELKSSHALTRTHSNSLKLVPSAFFTLPAKTGTAVAE